MAQAQGLSGAEVGKRVSRLQALETRRGVEKLIQQDIVDKGPSSEENTGKLVRGRKGFVTFSGDGNTRLPTGVPQFFANSKHELVGEEPREKESGKIHPPGRRREQKTDG